MPQVAGCMYNKVIELQLRNSGLHAGDLVRVTSLRMPGGHTGKYLRGRLTLGPFSEIAVPSLKNPPTPRN